MIKIPNLTPEMVKLTEIIHYDKNAKKHPDEQISKIANSIKEFGFRQPIILNNPKDKVIVCGHGRIFAANKLDMKEVPVLYADDMTEAQIKAFRIADNRITESEWDFDILKLDFEGMTEQEINLTGFEFGELDNLDKIHGENKEWIGMPEFQERGDDFKIVIHFSSKYQRDEFNNKYNFKYVKKEETAWSMTWPYE
jgi:DNA-binding cell septation regulator SpoVG